jgi:CRP-like cAMP-binding protein
LRRVLGIEAGEGRVFAWGALTLGLLGAAEVSLRNVAETLFIKRVGVEHLPGVFLVNDLLLTLATLGLAGVAARADRLRMLPRVLAAMGAALLPLWALAHADLRASFALLLLASKLVPAFALIVFWIAMGDLLHGRQAKRLFAPMLAGVTVGTLAGSFASEPLGRALGVAGLLPVSGGLLLLAAGAALPLRGLRPRLERARRPPAAALPRGGLAAFPALWRESGLFRLLCVIAAASGILAPMLYWEFSYLADRATAGPGGEARLLAFYASFRGWISLGVLAAQLFATSGLFRRLGIPLAATIPPLVYLAGFGALSLEMGLAAGVAAMAATQVQDKAVHDPALRVLMSLFPESIRSRASAILEGPVKRGGGAVGNLLVINALAAGSAVWVGHAALPLALAWLAAVLTLWRLYPHLLLRTAAQRGRRDPALGDAELLDRATLRALSSELASPDPARARAALALVAEAPAELAAGAFASALAPAPAAFRPALVAALDRVLEASATEPIASPEAARALEGLLEAPGALGARERADLVQAYGRLAGHVRDAASLVRALGDPSPAVRLAALAATARGGPAHERAELDAAIARGLASADEEERRTAREECRWLLLAEPPEEGFDARLASLAALLDAPEPRAAAAEAIAEVAGRHGARSAGAAGAMLAHRDDPEPRLRAALLRYVGSAGLAEHAGWLVEHLGEAREEWAEAAREALRALGPACADVLLRELAWGRRGAQPDLLELVRELDVGRPLLATLYERDLAAVERDLLHVAALGDRERFAIVSQRLAERVDEGLHAALRLLAALRDEERIARLGELLHFARGGRRHAILLEALESLLGPEERSRLMPLLEGGNLAERGRLAARALGTPVPRLDEAVAALRADPEELARLLAEGVALAGREGVGETLAVKAVEVALQLRSLPIFEGLTTRQLVDLARVVKREAYDAGTCVAQEGSFDDCLYLVVEGVVRVTRGDAFLAELGAGSFFGEVAVFEGSARSATVTTATRVRLLRLERADLLERMDELPGLAIKICQALSRRVRHLTEQLERGPIPRGEPEAGRAAAGAEPLARASSPGSPGAGGAGLG